VTDAPGAMLLRTAGQRVAVDGTADTLREVIAATGAAHLSTELSADLPNVKVSLERSRQRFDTSGCETVTRGAWTNQRGEALIESVGGSGFSQLWSVSEDGLHVRSRWTPTTTEAAASRLLPSRFRTLRAQVLVHYPALWLAIQQGFAPLHVSVVEIGGVSVLLAGPGGVGKSTLVALELAAGARATCDNIAVCDGIVAHGLAEPLRLPAELPGASSGPRTTHGRREQLWKARVRSLEPSLIVVVRRGVEGGPQIRPIGPGTALRGIVAGTYAAGELRRFWPLVATLAMATGCGPVHPRVEQVAETLASRLPCVELRLGHRPGAGLAELLDAPLSEIRRNGVN
jgi:hypothetical protein